MAESGVSLPMLDQARESTKITYLVFSDRLGLGNGLRDRKNVVVTLHLPCLRATTEGQILHRKCGS